MCTCVSVCAHVCMCRCVYVSVCVYMCRCVCARVSVCVLVCVCVHMSVYVCMCQCVCVCVGVCVHACVGVYICVCVRDMYVHTPVSHAHTSHMYCIALPIGIHFCLSVTVQFRELYTVQNLIKADIYIQS